MPLTKGLRDEDNERYKNTLQRLIALTFVPENFDEIGRYLVNFGLKIPDLEQMAEHELLTKLYEQRFDFENAELFADFLAQSGFGGKAKAVYHYIQQSSQSFSLGIYNKINAIAP